MPLTPLVGRFRPFFNAETVLVTVAKAFFELLMEPFFPINLLDLTAFIPADIALLKELAFLFADVLGIATVGISPKIGLYKPGIGILGSP